jgi:serine/threonine protein kinase
MVEQQKTLSDYIERMAEVPQLESYSDQKFLSHLSNTLHVLQWFKNTYQNIQQPTPQFQSDITSLCKALNLTNTVKTYQQIFTHINQIQQYGVYYLNNSQKISQSQDYPKYCTFFSQYWAIQKDPANAPTRMQVDPTNQIVHSTQETMARFESFVDNTRAPEDTQQGQAHEINMQTLPEVLSEIEMQGYTILEKLGQGGMGVVVLAQNTKLNRKEAIKIILPGAATDRSTQRFKQEAKLTAQLDHPHIIGVYHLIEGSNFDALSMEYFKSQTLTEYVEEYGPVSIDHALDIMHQITLAINYAHKNKIIHRDIKPSNIFIDEAGKIKVGDFGLAGSIDTKDLISKIDFAALNNASVEASLTGAEGIIGSPKFSAPEQLKGELESVNHTSDFYALAASIYYILTGKTPFSGDDIFGILFERFGEKTQPMPLIYPTDKEATPQQKKLAEILIKCTRPSPKRRYKKGQDLLQDIEAAQIKSIAQWADNLSQYMGITVKLALVLLISIIAKFGIEFMMSTDAKNLDPKDRDAFIEFEPKKQTLKTLMIEGQKMDIQSHFLTPAERDSFSDEEAYDATTSIRHVLITKSQFTYSVTTYQIFKDPDGEHYRVCVITTDHKEQGTQINPTGNINAEKSYMVGQKLNTQEADRLLQSIVLESSQQTDNMTVIESASITTTPQKSN